MKLNIETAKKINSKISQEQINIINRIDDIDDELEVLYKSAKGKKDEETIQLLEKEKSELIKKSDYLSTCDQSISA